MVDPVTLLQGANAVKAAFDAFRAAIAGVKDIRSLASGTPEQNKVVDEALDHAVRTAAIAEAEVAKALGYELCKCEFPPTIMLTVGTHSGRAGKGGPVFECPKCGFDTAAPFTFTRTAKNVGNDDCAARRLPPPWFVEEAMPPRYQCRSIIRRFDDGDRHSEMVQPTKGLWLHSTRRRR